MRKESVDIAASATVLAHAERVCVRHHTSSAEDAGQPERNAKHFVQHCLNHAHMEVRGPTPPLPGRPPTVTRAFARLAVPH